MPNTINVHASMRAYNHTEKDWSKFHECQSQAERNQRVVALWKEMQGKQIHVVHMESGEVRLWEIPATGHQMYSGRVMCEHLIFGMWRIARPEDIARQDAKDKLEYERTAKAEAQRLARASGLVMTEMAGAAAAITRMNEAAERETAKAKR